MAIGAININHTDEDLNGTVGKLKVNGKVPEISAHTWILKNPVAGGVYGPRLDNGATIDKIEAWTDIGTINVNVEIRTSPNTVGTDAMTLDLTASSTGAAFSGTFNNNTISPGEWIYLSTITPISSPTALLVIISYVQ